MTRRLSIAALAALLFAGTAGAQQTQIRGFTDVTYRVGERGTEPSAFGLGQFDLYITSKLDNHFNFLGETVFEYDEGFIVDVERVIVSWEPRNWFNVAMGKHHTPIGYWNNAYHHGAVLQPTIERPLMFKFEDEGGVFPIHTTGILLAGRDIGPLHLGYDLMVGNGLGSTPTADDDPRKSVTAQLRTELTSTLTVGVSAYDDRVSAGVPTLAGDTLTVAMTQRMGGAFVTYLGAQVEVMAEFQRVMNHLENDGNRKTNASYAYAGYHLGSIVPYVRVDRIDFDLTDPYFVAADARMMLAGVRYDFSAAGAVKVEARDRKLGDAKALREIAAQVAIGF
ncbi:MAG TPA: hypothetical protein VHM67_10575 [Gemmatimonadaceae bacterium]|nr:hypothetical protein [Gemmatimonadaceae bacterium]